MGIHRSAVMRQDRADAAKAKLENRARKDKERIRRDARMIDKIKSGSLPFTPLVMSWLSRQLEKPSAKIMPEDIKTLVG